MEINLGNLLSGYKEMDLTSKSAISSVVMLMPFWYCNIYLYYGQIYANPNWALKISFLFCLSVSWYYVNLYANLFGKTILSEVIDEGAAYYGAVFGSISKLASLTFLDTILRDSWKYKYKLLTYFLIAIFSEVGMALYARWRKRQKDKRGVKAQSDHP